MGSCFLTCGTAATQIKMGKGQNEGGFSEDQLQMYKDCFKLMDINKDGTLDKNDLRGAFDNVGVLMSRENSTVSLARLEVPAPMTTWSRCSRRRWPETETTQMTSSSRPSRLMTMKARLTPRCSHTPS